MKTIFIFLLSFLSAISLIGQSSTVTINVRGNNNEQLIIDGKNYSVNYDYNMNNNSPIVISDLQSGQHTIEVKRSNEIDNTSTTFNVRSGYDLQITVTANGSIQLRETRWKTDETPQYRTPISDASFNQLYNDVRRQWGSNAKMNLLSDAFSNTNNYFTAVQTRQLIQLINNQNNRLSLTKAAYSRLTDPANYTQMYDLLNQSGRDDLTAYVNSYNVENSSIAMSSSGFNTIYRTAQRQSTTNSRVSYIYNAFTNTNNYFTVAQARQLIQLVPDEANRLHLAKISYRSIVDRRNFSRMNDLFRTQASRTELTTFVNTYDDSTPVYTKVAMKESDFNTLYRDIQNRIGIGAKYSALTDAFANENNYFTVVQARQLIQLVSSESNRLQLAKASYDNIVDPTNFSGLYDILGRSGKTELEAYVRTYEQGETVATYRSPMSDANFSALYNEVQNSFGLGIKMSKLTDIFENENNYFTVAQARQLIQLVSAESNRLQLAKSSYGNIVDPENFSLMYNLLTNQSSKNELSAYVNSYSYGR